MQTRAHQIAHYEPQWVLRAHFIVAICNHNHGPRSLNPAAKELEQVKRCFIGPMHVFEYDHGTRLIKFSERCAESYVPARVRMNCRCQSTCSLSRHVVKWR